MHIFYRRAFWISELRLGEVGWFWDLYCWLVMKNKLGVRDRELGGRVAHALSHENEICVHCIEWDTWSVVVIVDSILSV